MQQVACGGRDGREELQRNNNNNNSTTGWLVVARWFWAEICGTPEQSFFFSFFLLCGQSLNQRGAIRARRNNEEGIKRIISWNMIKAEDQKTVNSKLCCFFGGRTAVNWQNWTTIKIVLKPSSFHYTDTSRDENLTRYQRVTLRRRDGNICICTSKNEYMSKLIVNM